MSKKAWLNCIGCLIVGFAIGYFYAQAVIGKHIADYYASINLIVLGESGNRAYRAYQHESSSVAIYALAENLDKLKQAEDIGETPFISKQILSIDLMLTHARLAKLYAETGQTNLSSQHIVEALDYAKSGGKFSEITNQAALMEMLAKFDKIKSQ